MSLHLYSGSGSGSVSFAREAAADYGGGIRGEILAFFGELRVIGVEIRLGQGDVFAYLKENDRYEQAGYRKFGEYCEEILGLGESTAYERIRVRNLTSRYPEIKKEYIAARLTDRHVLDLGAVLAGAEETQVPVWVGRALGCTTRELRSLIRSEKPGAELEEEKSSFSYGSWPGLNEAYHATKNASEKMVGHRLSHETTMRTVLDEASSIPEPPEEGTPFVWKFAEQPHACGDEKHGAEQKDAESTEKRADRPIRPRVVTQSEIDDARRTMLAVREILTNLRISIRRVPSSYLEGEAIALDLLAKERALRIVTGRLLRTLYDCGGPWFGSLDAFHEAVASALGIGKRSVRDLARDALLFSARPRLRAAYERGKVTIGQAHVIHALGARSEEATIRDAACLTRTAFLDITTMMLRIKDLDPVLFRRVQGRMDYRVLMPGLYRTAARRYGISRAAIREAFRRNGLEATTPAGLRGIDPRESAILRRRIAVLLDVLGARIWKEELPEKTLAQMSRETRRVTRVYKSSTKKDLLDTLERIRKWQLREGDACPRERALFLLFRHVLETWLMRDPRLRIDPVILRDDFRCMVPGCRARGNLHDHHIEFVSRGGSDERWNRVSLCAYHHGKLHEGLLTVTGRADGILYWKIGTAEPRFYKGDVRLKVAARESVEAGETLDTGERLWA